MFIKLINSVNDKDYGYLLPAVLTQNVLLLLNRQEHTILKPQVELLIWLWMNL